MKTHAFFLTASLLFAGSQVAQASRNPTEEAQELISVAAQYPSLVNRNAKQGDFVAACRTHVGVQHVLDILQSNSELALRLQQENRWVARNILSSANDIQELSDLCEISPSEQGSRIQLLAQKIYRASMRE